MCCTCDICWLVMVVMVVGHYEPAVAADRLWSSQMPTFTGLVVVIVMVWGPGPAISCLTTTHQSMDQLN